MLAIYFLVTLLFIGYLEISGQYILYKFNKSDTFKVAFGFGFMALMAYGYLFTSILTYLNCSFYVVLAFYAFYFVCSIYFIIKDFKKVKWHFDISFFVLSLVFVCIMLYYAYNTKLGDTSGFDSTFYLNMISTNVGADHLNTKSVLFGTYSKDISAQYTFQSYYYFVSCFVYVISRILDTNNFVIIVWVFQILYNYFIFSLIYNTLNKIASKKYLMYLTIIFIYLFFYGKIYFNNVFGFYGNTYRTVAISYSIMALYEIFKNDDKYNWFILGICIYASCAFSSSAVFMTFFLLYGMFFVLTNNDKLFKYYSFILFMPLINLLCVLKPNKIVNIVLSILFCLFLFVFNDKLIKVTRKKYTRLVIIVFSFLLMVFLSYTVTHNIFDFNAFLNSGNEIYDMTITYTKNYRFFGNNEKLYRYIVWFLFAYAFLFENKNKLVLIDFVLLLIIFNPICCSYLANKNVVYYRAYELIVNPFTFILFMNMFFERINNKYVYYICLLCILSLFVKNTNFKTPLYYHVSFMPDDNYNNLMKMSNDEYDVIQKIKEETDYLGNDSPYIVTGNLFTEAFIPSGRYIFGRELFINSEWSEAERQMYAIFYPSAYLGDHASIEADYENIAAYIKEAGVDYIVVNKKEEIYDEDIGLYTYLVYKVAECGVGYSIYSNDSYELFYYGDTK